MSASARAWLDQQPIEPDYSRFDGCDEAPEPLAPAAPVVYATGEQKQEILRLSGRARAEGLLDTPRWTKLLTGINLLNEDEAGDELAKLHQLVGHLPAEDVRVILDRHFAGRAMLTTTALNTAR